jgi:hypothetical protein
MSTSPELKTCKKGLHQYPADKRRCPKCKAIANRQWIAANPQRMSELRRNWVVANLERQRKTVNNWRTLNADRYRESKRNWSKNNIEKQRESIRKWRTANLDKTNASVAKRRAKKKQAVAAWANHVLIKKMYAECCELTKTTGIRHHVDHIYPLKSDWLCGLHVENNLQILTETENTSKGNRIWPGQLDCQKASVYAIFPKELTDLLND